MTYAHRSVMAAASEVAAVHRLDTVLRGPPFAVQYEVRAAALLAAVCSSVHCDPLGVGAGGRAMVTVSGAMKLSIHSHIAPAHPCLVHGAHVVVAVHLFEIPREVQVE